MRTNVNNVSRTTILTRRWNGAWRQLSNADQRCVAWAHTYAQFITGRDAA